MKTVIVSSNVSWSIYNFRKNLLLSLIKNGFRVVVVAKNDEYSDRIISMGCEFIPLKINSSGKNPLEDTVTFLSLLKIFTKVKPDFILNFSPKINIYSSFASNFTSAKVINNVAGLGVVFIGDSLVSRIVKMLYKASQKRADIIFFQNMDDKELFIKSKICTDLKTDMLPGSGVDLKRFTPKLEKVQEQIVGLTFLFTSRLLYDKGILHYVEAARLLKKRYNDKVHFQILGFIDSDNPSAVNQDVMDRWVNEGVVEYLGVSDKVEEVVSNVDCVVLPSFYREGVPRSLLEASALGKPIITTDSVGCRNAVDDGYNGFLCKPRSTEDLLVKMDKFINLSSKEIIEMGENSRNKAEACFDENIVIDKYLSYLLG